MTETYTGTYTAAQGSLSGSGPLRFKSDTNTGETRLEFNDDGEVRINGEGDFVPFTTLSSGTTSTTQNGNFYQEFDAFSADTPPSYSVIELDDGTQYIFFPDNRDALDRPTDDLGEIFLDPEDGVVPCFTSGTRIATVRGEVAVEDLREGDRVMTRDNGFQEIRWIGSREVKGVGKMAPVKVSPGALNDNEKAILLSPNHRVLIRDPALNMLLATSEAFVAVKHLVNRDGITKVTTEKVRYYHILFDNHEVILSNEIWTESFHPGRQGVNAFDEEVRQELAYLFPELVKGNGVFSYGDTARTVLKRHESQLLARYLMK